MTVSPVRIATVTLLLGASLLLQGCIVAEAAGAVADVGVAVVKTTVDVGKAVIP